MINKKKVVLIVLVISISISGYIGWRYFNQRGLESSLSVEVVPASGSKIKLNGKGIREGTIKLEPGRYTIIFSHDGFKSNIRTINIQSGEEYYVGSILEPVAEKTANWYQENSTDAKKAEGISSRNFDQLTKNKVKKLPLINELPLVDLEYRIDYGRSQKTPDNPESVAIYIKYFSENGKADAVEWIRFKGYDPEKIEIIYQNANE